MPLFVLNNSHSGQIPAQRLTHIVTDYRAIATVSLLLSLWLVLIDPVSNRDAILYLRTAEAFLNDGFWASFATFDRPLVPIIFALIHKLTGLSLLHSGQVFTTLIYIALSLSFVRAIKELGGNAQVQAIAVVIILTHPIINSYRTAIMRDPGYWTFCILAMVELLRFSRSPSLTGQLRWTLYMGLAILFRFEGTLLALLTPLALYFTMDTSPLKRLRYALQLQLPAIVVAAVGISALGLDNQNTLLPHINNYSNNLWFFSDVIDDIALRTGPELLKGSAIEHARVAVFGGLIAIFLLNVVMAMQIVHGLVLLLGWRRGWLLRINADARVILNAHIAVCGLYLLIFTFSNQFMLERYAAQMVIFLLIYASFAAQGLWSEVRSSVLFRSGLILILLVLILDLLHNFNYRKAYLADATRWIQENTPADTTLLASDKHIAYFSRRHIDWAIEQNLSIPAIMATGQWRSHQYLALALKRHQLVDLELIAAEPALKTLKSFSNDRLDTVIVIENLRYQPTAPP
ncbi:MAG: hypothetical protein ACI9GW_001076 [Halieaceae bacterium]|jgi:hypothetical protein